MYDVMEGVRVVEVAEHTFVPAAAMQLADWGADVIKIERTSGGGDPMRSLAIPNLEAGGYNPFFEAGNRGKRSLALDLHQPAGREILYRLVKEADVFTTNLRADARAKLGIEPEDLFAINPRLIYARGTGYGREGPFAAQGGFDNPSTWVRGGLSYLHSRPGEAPPSAATSIGDLTGGITTAGAIAAALFRRERTGKGAVVDNALYAVGTYLNSQIIAMSSMGIQKEPQNIPREDSFSPLVLMYRTKDDRWLNLCLLMPHWWPDFCRHIDREDLIADERFADPKARHANRGALIAELDAVFATRTLAQWVKRLETMEGVWAPCFSPAEVAADPQALVNGFVVPVGPEAAPEYMVGSTPCQFDERPVGALRRGPAYGEHSAEILASLGIAGAELESLREAGVVR
ncbi:CaiB/BaiF CoA transferase family protein [Novosphingobium bradum]|uniref:CaiB/BaiF CoA transferase family protein n=1 Tax=Novosphingobium bradum TaxID=1737444 RepID=A0ABV7IU89_9SPHN